MTKATRVTAWVMTIATAGWLAVPTAAAQTPVYRFKWISQTPATVTADGTAHYVSVTQGNSVTLSVTVQNLSGKTIKGRSALGAIPAGKQTQVGSFGIGVRGDLQTPWLDASSFVLNGNRLVYYEGADVAPNANITMTFTVKVASTAANGTYNLYYKPVFDYEAWTRQVAWNGRVLDKDKSDIFTRFFVGTSVPVGGGDLNVATASTTPPASNAAKGAVDVTMAQITFGAGSTNNALISSIAIARSGLSADADISDIKLYDGATKIGSTQGINTTSHKATFTGLSWLIPAGTSKTLTIKGTVASSGGTGVGAIIQMGVASAADITLSGGGVVAGTFPAYGNGVTIAGVSVGILAVTAPTSPASANVVSGSTDQDLGAFKFEATSTEGFNVNSITLTEVGTSVDSDVSNMKLEILGVQIGSTVANLTNGSVTFTGSPLFNVPAGQNKVVYVVGNIASAVTSTRTIIFQIEDITDVVAYGQNSSGIVTISATTGGPITNPFTATSAAGTFTIVQGAMTVVEDPTNLETQTYIVGEEQVEVGKFKFSASSTEALKVTKIIFDENEDASSTDYQNARLYINDSATPIATSGSIASATVTFEDGNGLFEVPVSGNTVVTLKVDISTSAVTADTLEFGLGTTAVDVTNLTIYGVSSGDKVPTTSYTLTGVHADGMNVHEIDPYGALVVSNGPSTPVAANFALGQTNLEIFQFRMQASSEAMRVTSLIVRMYEDNTAGTDTDASDTGATSNAKLYAWNGTAWVQLGSTVASPSSGVASYNFDHTIPKNTTHTFKFVVDIPTTSSDTYLYATLPGGGTIADDISATGVSSSATIVETGSGDGNLFTKAVPIITVAKSDVPAARTVIKNGNDVLLAKFFLSASSVEDIKVSTLKIYADTANTLDTATPGIDGDINNIYLQFDDNGTWRKTNTENLVSGTPDSITYTGSDFLEPTEWVIPKGGSLIVEIRGDIIDTGTAYFGMTTSATNVVGSGVSSGTAATIYDYDGTAYNTVWYAPLLTMSANGTLTVTVATDTPTVQQVTASYDTTTMTPTFFRAKLAAANEDIVIDAIRAKVTDQGSGTEDDNFAGTVYVYKGGTMVGNVLSGGTLVATGTLQPVSGSDAAANIIFTTPVTIPVGGSEYLTLTAVLNSITNGADSGEVPYLGIDSDNEQAGSIWYTTGNTYNNKLNIRATGVSSGTVITDANDDGATAILKGKAVYVVKTKLGLALSSSTESGSNIVRRAGDKFFTVNATNSNATTDAVIRSAQVNTADAAATAWTGASTAAGTWAVVSAGDDGSTLADDSTNYVDGTGSQAMTQGATTPAAGNGMTQTFAARDLSTYAGLGFWVRASRASIVLDITLTGASGGTTTYQLTPGVNSQWQFVNIPFAATYWTTRTAVTAFKIISNTAYTAADTLNVDGLVFYRDYVSLNLVSNAGLIANTTASLLGSRITLADSSDNVLAYGNSTGTAATQVSTSYGTAYFFPTTDISIPASGKTFVFSADTSVLITGTKTLTTQLVLGAATTAGAQATSGSVWWNDNSSSTYIFWVDSPGGTLQSSISYL